MSFSRLYLQLIEGLFCSLFSWKRKLKHIEQDYWSGALALALLHRHLQGPWPVKDTPNAGIGSLCSYPSSLWGFNSVLTSASDYVQQGACAGGHLLPLVTSASVSPGLCSCHVPWLCPHQVGLIGSRRAHGGDRALCALPPIASALPQAPSGVWLSGAASQSRKCGG